MAVGRAGGPLDRSGDQLRTLMHGVDLPVAVVYDPTVIDRQAAQLAASVQRAEIEASAVFKAGADGAAASWKVRPAAAGADVSDVALSAAGRAAVDALGTTTVSTQISVAPVITEPTITTDEVQAAVTRANAMSSTDLALVDGTTTYTIPAGTLQSRLTLGPSADGSYSATLDTAAITAALPPLLAAVAKAPVEASLAFAAGNTVVAVPGQPGRALDIGATVAAVVAALSARAAGTLTDSVDVATAVVDPTFTTAQAEEAAPRVVMVSHWITHFIPGVSNFFGHNISVPTTALDAQVLGPGDWFDFWKAIGVVSKATGYGPGGAIINGHSRPTGALAGGICSCSTTIFNAALRAGLQMGARRNHYYYIDRYPVGLDATVFKSSGGSTQTMRFRNDTAYPVLIRGINGPGTVRFEIWTVPTGRTVTFTDPIIKDRTTAHDTIEYTDRLAPGATRRIEYPTNGFRAWVTRTVTDASGAVVHTDTFYSNYSAVDGVTLVGRSPGDPPSGTVVVVR